MRRICLLSFAALLIIFNSIPLLAQKGSSCPDDLIPQYDKRRKQWGYADLFGHWVIEALYTKVSPFVENKAVVQKGNLMGVIDCDGNVILLPKYEALTNFRYGKVWAMQEGKWGLVDDKGKLLMSHEYSDIFPIEMTELCWVKKDGKWGLFNEVTGKWLCIPQFPISQVMSENCSLVQADNGKFGVINHVNCAYLLQPEITSVKKLNSRAIIYKSKGKWGVFSNEGVIKANAEYDTIFQMSSHLLNIQKNGKYGLMILDGKTVLDPQYDYIGPYSDGAFLLKKDEKFGYANVFGKIQIEPQYSHAEDLKNRMAIVVKDGKYAVINLRNEYILKPEYRKIRNVNEFKALVVTTQDQEGNDKEFLYNGKGEKITTTGFDEVITESTGPFLRVKANGMIRYFSVSEGNYAFQGAYEDARDFSEGYARVKKDGKWGIINEKGEEIVPALFEKVIPVDFGARKVFFTKDKGTGFYDETGKEILKPVYDTLCYSYPNLIKAVKGGKAGVLKSDGTVLVDFIYESISLAGEFNGNPEWPAIIRQDGKYGLMDDARKVIYKPSADNIFYAGEGFYAVKEKKGWGLLHNKGINEPEAEYDTIGIFGDHLIAVRKGKKWGYLDKNLSPKIAFSFEEAYPFADYMAVVKKGGRYGVIDIRGEFLVPAEYERLEITGAGRFLLKEGRKFLIGKGGKLTAL